MNEKDDLFVNTLGMVLSYVLTYFVHAYAHSFASWWYGLNNHPFMLNFPSFWLQNITENIGLSNIEQDGNYYSIGVIGLTGYLSNWILIWAALILFYVRTNSRTGVCFLYWLFVWNLATVFNYIPHHMLGEGFINQTFDSMGVSSVWLVYLTGGAAALCMIFTLFYSLIFKVFKRLNILKLQQRRVYFTITLLIVFFYNGLHYGWAHVRILSSSAGIFIWFKLIAFTIMLYTIDLRHHEREFD